MSGGPSRSGDRKRSNNKPSAHRVGVGDAERVTDRAVRRAAPSLAVDVGATGEVAQVPHHEEVAGKAERFDEREFVVDLFVRAGHALLVALAVALLGAASR